MHKLLMISCSSFVVSSPIRKEERKGADGFPAADVGSRASQYYRMEFRLDVAVRQNVLKPCEMRGRNGHKLLFCHRNRPIEGTEQRNSRLQRGENHLQQFARFPISRGALRVPRSRERPPPKQPAILHIA